MDAQLVDPSETLFVAICGCFEPGDQDLDGHSDSEIDPDTGLPCDNCPGVYNPAQRDSDNDGMGDECDPCPHNANTTLTEGNCPGACCFTAASEYVLH